MNTPDPATPSSFPSLLHLDAHRERLHDSINSLTAALSKWRSSSAEYEAFREELSLLPASASREVMLTTGLEIEGEELTEDEIKQLLGDRARVKRSRDQVVVAIGHRLTYVDENISKIEKQITALEEKTERFDTLEQELVGEDGERIVDIREELDEDGNVTGSTLGGGDSKELLEGLKTFQKFLGEGEKSGMWEKAAEGRTGAMAAMATAANPTVKAADSKNMSPPQKPEGKVEVLKDIQEKAPPKPALKSALKSTPKPAPAAAKPASALTNVVEKAPPTPIPKSSTAKSAPPEPMDIDSDTSDDELMSGEGGGYVRVLEDPAEPKEEDWVKEIPGEDPNEAQLRREMLEYSMLEMKHVVAELNAEEGDFYEGEDDSDIDEEEYQSDDDDDDSDEDEDEFGRTTKRVVSDRYREEMEELQRMIKEREDKFKGPKPIPSQHAQVVHNTMRQAAMVPPAKPAMKKMSNIAEALAPTPVPKKLGKKGVRFAEALDIAPSAPPAPAPTTIEAPEVPLSSLSLSDIAPHDVNAIPYMAELLARDTLLQNSGPSHPFASKLEAPEPEPVVERKPKGASLFRQELAPASSSSSSSSSSTTLPLGVEAPRPVSKTVPTSAVSDSVMERAPGAADVPVMAPSMPKKMSRFRAAQQAAAAEPELAVNFASHPKRPLSPEPELAETHNIMRSTVMERPPGGEAKEPDDMDPEFHRQEVANSFHKLRNRMIHAQGGFQKDEEESEMVPVNEGVGAPKVSRFKAARLKGLGM